MALYGNIKNFQNKVPAGSQSYYYGYKRDAGSIPVLRETVVSLNGKTITYFRLL